MAFSIDAILEDSNCDYEEGFFDMDDLGRREDTHFGELGSHLLSDISKQQKVNRIRIKYIDYKDVIPNPLNKGYSKDDVKELADSIRLAGGIKQPCIVKDSDENGNYMLLTGERRLLATQMLVEQEGLDEFRMMPCYIDDPQTNTLPISEDLKETLSVLITNQYREKTDADRYFEYKEWNKIYKELRNNGIREFTVTTETGKETFSMIGRKTRELVAEHMQISSAQAGKFGKVEKNGSEGLKNALESGKITVNQAARIADMEKEEQEEIIDDLSRSADTDEGFTPAAIRNAVSKKNNDTVCEQELVPEPAQTNELSDDSIAEESNGNYVNATRIKRDFMSLIDYAEENEIIIDDPDKVANYHSLLSFLGRIIKS